MKNLKMTAKEAVFDIGILNLQVARAFYKNFNMGAMTASWILKWKDFNSSEPLCHLPASHQDSVQSDIWFWKDVIKFFLKNFKTVTDRMNLAIFNL